MQSIVAKKIDWNDIILKLIEIHGSDFLLYISAFILFLTGLYIGFRVLKHKGYFSTPIEKNLATLGKSLTEIKRDITDVRNDIGNNFDKMIELMEIFIENQRSKLSEEQVSILVEEKLFIYKKRFIEVIMDIYERNHIRDNKNKTISKIKENFETIIIDEDHAFYKMPDTLNAMLSTNEKLTSLKDENIYERIYNIMIESDDIRNVKRNVVNLLDNFVLRRWVSRM